MLGARGPGAVPAVAAAGRAGRGAGAHLGQGAAGAQHQAADAGRCLRPAGCHPHQPRRGPWRAAGGHGQPPLTVLGWILKRGEGHRWVGRAGCTRISPTASGWASGSLQGAAGLHHAAGQGQLPAAFLLRRCSANTGCINACFLEKGFNGVHVLGLHSGKAKPLQLTQCRLPTCFHMDF